MAAGQIIVPGAMPTRDRNGRATVGKLFFYEDGTQTPKAVYSSSALTTELANPVVSNAAGRFPAIWANDAELYTVTWTYDDEEVIQTFSGVSAAKDAVLASVALAGAAADEAAADAAQVAADYAAILAIEAAGSTAPAIAGKLNRNGDNAQAGLYAAIGEQTTALTAATDVQDADLLATYRSTGPLKKLTALIFGNWVVKTLTGFIQSGTGAVAETVQTVLRRPSICVDSFGAVGNGVTDDQPAIVAAQTALLAQGGGQLVFTRGKTYAVNSPIPMASGVAYVGAGRSGISQVNSDPGAVILAKGTAAFINAATTLNEIQFRDLFIRSTAGGGHIWDWSLAGVTAKIEIVGVTVVQENADKYIIRGTAAGGVFSIWAHDWEWQYATANSVPPIYFASETINSIVLEKFWSTCTTEATSGTYAVHVESTNLGGAGFNVIIRDGVFELPGGGSVKMLSCTESGIENCTVYDLTVTPNNIQFFIGDGAGPPAANCWMKGCQSRVGTALVPDAKIDCSVSGQAGFMVDNCSFLYLDGGAATPGMVIHGGNIANFQNAAYTRLTASPTLDLHFGTTDGSGKSYTLWNGYSGLGNGYLNFYQNGGYIGAFSPTGLFQWGGTRGVPGFYVTQGGTVFTRSAVYPGTPAGSDQGVAGLYAGSGAPNNANGVNGDFYFRSDGTVAGNTVMYHKEGGAWVPFTTT